VAILWPQRDCHNGQKLLEPKIDNRYNELGNADTFERHAASIWNCGTWQREFAASIWGEYGGPYWFEMCNYFKVLMLQP